MESINQREQEGKPVVVDGLMSEAELRQAFDIEPICPEIPQKQEEVFLQGMPVPPSEPMRLMGDIAAPSNSDLQQSLQENYWQRRMVTLSSRPLVYAVCLKCFRKEWIMIALSMKGLINLSLGLIAI